ncbi:Endoribonuclease L-PSP [Aminobacter sp. MSH1]|nr:Endoribonuclease L-PSP [Aminobacter sp. MSH1]
MNVAPFIPIVNSLKPVDARGRTDGPGRSGKTCRRTPALEASQRRLLTSGSEQALAERAGFDKPLKPQMRYMLKKVAAICEAAGTSLENVVRRACFHDRGDSFAEGMDEWATHFPSLKPVSTTIIVGLTSYPARTPSWT